jgi:dihydroorotate dehydrogenase
MVLPAQTALQPTIISAPFGNYIQPRGATPTLGTFTASARPGRWRRTLQTVRYYPRLKAWVNRIGLRNPGMGWLMRQVDRGRIDPRDKIISIHGFDEDQWSQLLRQADELGPAAIELNMSCPNVGEVDWPSDLFERAAALATPIIVKLPPIHYELMVDQAREAGLSAFHCCNTLPIPAGGLSGAPLKPLSLRCIRLLRASPGGAKLTLIGGGGIGTLEDIDAYASAGADHVALGTKTMNPWLLVTDRSLWPLVDYAHQRLVEQPEQ